MKLRLSVSGMSCAHCVAHVENALREVNGVAGAKADLATNSAVVELTETVPGQSLRAAVEEAGYEVTGVETVA